MASGGTLGSLLGPALTVALLQVPTVAAHNNALLLLSAGGFVAVALLAAVLESAGQPPARRSRSSSLSLSSLSSFSPAAAATVLRDWLARLVGSRFLVAMSFFMLALTACMTTSGLLVRATVRALTDEQQSSATMTLYANVDLGANLLALLMQVTLTDRLLECGGIRVAGIGALFSLFAFFAVCLSSMLFDHTLFFAVAAHALRRALNFAIIRPCRELAFSRRPDERKSHKSVLDVVVYRGGDLLSSAVVMWFDGSPSTLAVAIGAPASLLWLFACEKLAEVS